jgi:hypothetical protein
MITRMVLWYPNLKKPRQTSTKYGSGWAGYLQIRWKKGGKEGAGQWSLLKEGDSFTVVPHYNRGIRGMVSDEALQRSVPTVAAIANSKAFMAVYGLAEGIAKSADRLYPWMRWNDPKWQAYNETWIEGKVLEAIRKEVGLE